MVYDSEEEMNNVVGLFSGNSFIKQQQDELKKFKSSVNVTMKKFTLPVSK